MKKKEILHKILAEKAISIVRLKQEKAVSQAVHHLVRGGIKVLEITSNTPNFDLEIRKARSNYSATLIGAGTITTKELAIKAIAAGAQFLVTPNTNETIVTEAKKADIPVVMGAFTPTEIANAVAFGADIVKLFPAANLGVSYYKSLRGPFDNVKFFVVGGIDQDTMQDWFEAGIDGVGIGSALVKSDIQTIEDLNTLEQNATRFVERLNKIRGFDKD
ncbi:bifunctional 4-hydroxy-2-oxoglutarate aldolase/2-dehydro-3-deoxy-phosphogluconate aldolase [Flagellimonas myxillae]|uniref:bifunctional 4-hydroxy-2-oxoglutarate aldolase/2-dehydro-3-deoxy-phosphogluconate aldolase n=1 Tax=Flagellimonas myxillae TaxID=2942214 RepID=UPI00201FB39B|nr:bifunctional 4-hydroxy-2-oxoglutarate aldolase/2-dehydro-3-deoxy-phosphogluconate aldolase [Muricauda myxillae]MCL6267915.1 bifunctional 4-hydroxy-2-oxoglutarate aldolase/2-dehydro-3-deoxy-phosphogluconate aldolase [Muricauda myxillae]